MAAVVKDNIMRRYIAYLHLEKGMTDNTIEAYIDDVEKLIRYLELSGCSWQEANRDVLVNFVCTLQDVGIGARSQARVISGVKSFFRFLKLEGFIEEDFSESLEMPRLGRQLPSILSVDEINAMIESIDLAVPEGQRNRAIIEVLYSCGLRVSELVGLRISQLYLDDEYICVEGKGGKQRLVPISVQAIREIEQYMLVRAKQ